MTGTQPAPLKKKLKSIIKKVSKENARPVFYLAIGPQQEECQVNCLMTVRDSNLLQHMDEQLRTDWLF